SSTDPKRFPKPDISAYVQDSPTLIQLGKAFSWDMQMGSDGIQACASCHFHAVADYRIKNALNPGTNATPPVTGFMSDDFNYTLAPADYPFHRFSDRARSGSRRLHDFRQALAILHPPLDRHV